MEEQIGSLPASGAKAQDHSGHSHGDGFFSISGEKTELLLSVLCGIFLGIGFGLSFINSVPDWVSILLFIGAYITGGFFTTIEAYEGISKGHFEIDFLMLVAAIGAAFLGAWAEGALLLFLFSLGHALEHHAMNKARKSIEALADLAPKTALKKEADALKEVYIEDLSLNDIILVRPNSKIPADGMVVKGNSAVNQAPITGESIPVDKIAFEGNTEADSLDKLDAKYRVFAGTINGAGTLEIRVLRLAADSTISRLITLVNEAQTQKSPAQHFADRIEKYYVPAVLILVGVLLFAFIIIDEPFSVSFYRAMSVLVAASPCALAISTPSDLPKRLRGLWCSQ